MGILKIIFLAVLLSGCAEFQALKNGVGAYGSQAADETLNTSIWTLCNASSIGAIERKFQTDEQLQARKVICEIP